MRPALLTSSRLYRGGVQIVATSLSSAASISGHPAGSGTIIAPHGRFGYGNYNSAIASVEGISPYSQSKSYEVDKLQGEGFEDYEKRTWPNRMHVDQAGMVFIPPMAYKNALAETAKFMAIPIPGKGKANYTKHFEAGVLSVTPASLGIKAADVGCERLFVPADGRRGSGKRVHKYFPLIPPGWKADFVFLVLDDTVLQTSARGDFSVFQEVLDNCGKLVGIGRFRPRNNGFYGRFEVKDLTVMEGLAAA